MSCKKCKCSQCQDLRAHYSRDDDRKGNVVCQLCGAGGSSKCPSRRNVFPSDQIEAGWWSRASMGFTTKEVGDGERSNDRGPLVAHTRLVLEAPVGNDETPSQALVRLFERINRLPEGKYQQYACKHVWEHRPGKRTCSFCYKQNVMT